MSAQRIANFGVSEVTARNIICGLLLIPIMWALKQFATWGVYSAHGDLFFLAGLSVIFTIAYVIDRRAAAQRASREDTGITEQQGKPLASLRSQT